MIFTPKLSPFVKRDGTANVQIYIYDSVTQLQERIKTNYYVKPSDWEGAGLSKKSPNHAYINPSVKGIALDIENYWLKNQRLTPKELKAWYEGDKVDVRYTPVSYYDHYIQLCKDGKVLNKKTKEKLSSGYIAAIGVSSEYLKKFADTRSVSFQDINEEFYDEFVSFKRSIGLAQNTIVKSVKHFKMIVSHAKKKGAHKNQFSDYSIPTIKSQKIKLTPDEIEQIIKLDLTDDPDLVAEHERFQVAYNLLLRFGDTIAISEKNIVKKDGRYFLSAFTQKTKKEILLPIKKSVYAILKRNNFQLKAINSISNDKLKRLGMKAKINDNVTLTEFRNGVKTETVYKKYQLMETHTTRRSAARNLYDAGMDPLIIMVLGGWKTLKQLLEYIDIDLDFAAKKAIDHPFFD